MRISNAKQYFNEDVPFEPMLDETRVRMNKPAWFIGTTLASGLKIRESLSYYHTYKDANDACASGKFIPDTDAVTHGILTQRIEAQLKATDVF